MEKTRQHEGRVALVTGAASGIGLQIAQRIPGADLHMLGRCGHVPHLERPRDFIHLLTRFLA